MEDPTNVVASEYELRAWETLRTAERKRQNGVVARAGETIAGVAQGAVEQIRRLPPADAAMQFGDETLMKALEGGFKAMFLPAVRSVSLENRVKKLRKKHSDPEVTRLFRVLDLKDLDKGRPKLTLPLVGVLEGSAASVAITGATVSTTVSGGTTVAIALSALAADTVASLALLGRAVAEVAAHYGYDPREPEEELFLMSVLNYSSASSSTARAAALASLSRLSQQMMRRATWRQLGKDPLVKLIQRIFQTLGLRLTHKRLATVVPFAGVVVAGGLSFQLLHSAIEDATRVYRARYLAEKHGWDWDGWGDSAEGDMADEGGTDDAGVWDTVVQVEELIDKLGDRSERQGQQ